MKFIQLLFACIVSFSLYDSLQADNHKPDHKHNHLHEFIGSEFLRHGKDIIRMLPAMIASEWLFFSEKVKNEVFNEKNEYNKFSVPYELRLPIHGVQLSLNLLPAIYEDSVKNAVIDILGQQSMHIVDQEAFQWLSEESQNNKNLFSVKNLLLSTTCAARICWGVCHHKEFKKFDKEKLKISIAGSLIKEVAVYFLKDKIAAAIADDYKTMEELTHIEIKRLIKDQSFVSPSTDNLNAISGKPVIWFNNGSFGECKQNSSSSRIKSSSSINKLEGNDRQSLPTLIEENLADSSITSDGIDQMRQILISSVSPVSKSPFQTVQTL